MGIDWDLFSPLQSRLGKLKVLDFHAESSTPLPKTLRFHFKDKVSVPALTVLVYGAWANGIVFFGRQLIAVEQEAVDFQLDNDELVVISSELSLPSLFTESVIQRVYLRFFYEDFETAGEPYSPNIVGDGLAAQYLEQIGETPGKDDSDRGSWVEVVDTLESQVSDLRSQLKDRPTLAEVQQLKVDLQVARNEQSRLTAQVNKLLSDLSSLSNQKQELENSVAGLKGKLDLLSSKASEYDKVSASYFAVERERDNLAASLSQKEAAIATKENEYKILADQLRQSKADHKDVTSDVSIYQGEISELKEQVKAISGLQQQLKVATAQNERFVKDNKQLSDKLHDVNAQLKESQGLVLQSGDNRLSLMSQQLTDALKNFNAEKQAANQAKADLAKQKVAYAELVSESNFLQAKVDDSKAKIKVLELKLEKTISDHESEIKRLNVELEKFTNPEVLTSRESEIKILHERIARMDKVVADWDKANEGVEVDLVSDLVVIPEQGIEFFLSNAPVATVRQIIGLTIPKLSKRYSVDFLELNFVIFPLSFNWYRARRVPGYQIEFPPFLPFDQKFLGYSQYDIYFFIHQALAKVSDFRFMLLWNDFDESMLTDFMSADAESKFSGQIFKSNQKIKLTREQQKQDLSYLLIKIPEFKQLDYGTFNIKLEAVRRD